MNILQWLNKTFLVHDRSEELKNSAPPNIRDASHDLTNATMVANQKMREVRKEADALTALVNKAQRNGKHHADT